jgi:hypothetical protein
MYRVLAVTDISQPQRQKGPTINGRLLETNVEEGTEEGNRSETNRCLQLALCPASNPSIIRTALEVQPLSCTINQLLGSLIRVNAAEERHGVMLLTPTNTQLTGTQINPEVIDVDMTPSISEIVLDDILLSDTDIAQIL